MAADIQALADELAKLNRNSTLWAQPQMQQSGAAAMISQNQVQLQPYLQDYAYANPGATSPAHQFADPRAANYALQQQYFLNPYRAQAYGGDFNSNMPGAEFSTSSRLGIYRPGQAGSVYGGASEPGFVDDVAALTGFKSYAGYQNPYQAQIDASRRMSERGESIAMGAIEVAGFGASLAIPGALGLGVGLAAPMVVGAVANQYFARRNETGAIHSVMQDIVSGSAATGLTGRGVSMGEASKMMREMRLDAASDPTKSIEDYHTILQTGAATGLFNFEDSGGEVTAKVRKASKMINMMMMLAEDPDIQSTVKRMSDFQAMGVSIDKMERMTSDMAGFARLSNTSFDEVMSRGGALGAQQAQMMGGSAAFGMRAGGLAQSMANQMVQSGELSPEEVALRGGKSGMMQSMAGMITNNTHSFLAARAGAFMNKDGSFSQEKFADVLSGKGNSLKRGLEGFQGMDPSTFLLNYEDAIAEAESSLTPYQMVQMQETIMNKTIGASRGQLSKADYFSAFGKEGKALEYFMSADNKANILINEATTRDIKRQKRITEYKNANRTHNKLLRVVGEGVTKALDLEIFDDITIFGDRRAAAEVGGAVGASFTDTSWMPTDKSWMTKSQKTRFDQSSKKLLDVKRRFVDTKYDLFNTSENEGFQDLMDMAAKRFMYDKAGNTQLSRKEIQTKVEDAIDSFSKANRNRSTKKLAGRIDPNERDQILENIEELAKGEVFDAFGFESRYSSEEQSKMIQVAREFGDTHLNNMLDSMETTDTLGKKDGIIHRLKKNRPYLDAVTESLGKGKGALAAQSFSTLRGMGLKIGEIQTLIEKGGDAAVFLQGKTEEQRNAIIKQVGILDANGVTSKSMGKNSLFTNLMGADLYFQESSILGSKSAKLGRISEDGSLLSSAGGGVNTLQEDIKKVTKALEEQKAAEVKTAKVNSIRKDPAFASATSLGNIEQMLGSMLDNKKDPISGTSPAQRRTNIANLANPKK